VRALPGKVLVVEDNELNLKLFCDLLEVHGYEPTPVRDGLEAIGTARSVMPDLIIMDIQLPHVSGLELIQSLKADTILAPVPILAVTAYSSPADEEKARAAGAAAYVSKPITLMSFVEAVEALAPAG
jgi:two-component system, cell cycle response regulator DivK